MPVNTPADATEVIARSRTDVARSLDNSNPFLRNHWLESLVNANGNRNFDFYFELLSALKEAFPDTAIDNFPQWAGIYNISRGAAFLSSGKITFTGPSAGGVIPILTVVASSDGSEYETQAAGTIVATVLTISSLTRIGSIATAVTASAHNLGSGSQLVISGATGPEYNLTNPPITVVDATSFTYVISGTPTSPDGGSPIATALIASVDVVSLGFGVDQNQSADVDLSLQTPISGVNDSADVTQAGLVGATDQELLTSWQGRTIERIQNPVANFNVAKIVSEAKTIAGVTRVFVFEITPAVGQVTIYFMRDNDVNSIPSNAELLEVKAVLLLIKPATTDPDDVIVTAPTAVPTAFDFNSGLSPDTASMRLAVTASLQQFFSERTLVGVAVDEDAYRAAVFNTVDETTGDVVTSFTLSAPSGDIAISATQIATLGTVTF